ncbi:MAG: ABC transporter ATP-binding protein [Armatimonadetes bacterium]|nr:ABC transporter ATP-binding protein [Armatimonadota bacterium]
MATPIVLEVHGLSAPPRVRSEVSFTLRAGERLCIYGRNGAGKTALLRALLGLHPHRGQVVWQTSHSSTGYAAQRPRLLPRASVLQQLLWCAQLQGVFLSPHGSRVYELLELFGLSARRQQKVGRLSPGEQVKLELCCAVAVAARLLVVDGLLEMLDERTRERFWEEVDVRCARRELALLYATVSAREAELADRVLLLHEGRLVALDTPERLRRCVEPEVLSLRSAHAAPSLQPVRVFRPAEREGAAKQGESPLEEILVQRTSTMEEVLQVLLQRGHDG